MKFNNSNLNVSLDRANYLKSIRRNKIFVLSFQILLFVLFVALWELLTVFKILDPFYFSSPSKMIKSLASLIADGSLLYHIGITLYEAIIAFVISTVLGFLCAVALWWSDKLRQVLEPYLVVLNSLPKIALGPIIIVWFGAGTKAIVVMAFLILIIITILSMLNSFINCDKDKILLLKSMNASKFQIFFKLILPSSISDFISILKINVGMTWVGTIMGEYLVSSSGLGYLIVYGGNVFKLDLVMASTFILCLLAGGMYALIALAEKKINKNLKS